MFLHLKSYRRLNLILLTMIMQWRGDDFRPPPRKQLVWAPGQEVTATTSSCRAPGGPLQPRGPPRGRGACGACGALATPLHAMMEHNWVNCCFEKKNRNSIQGFKLEWNNEEQIIEFKCKQIRNGKVSEKLDFNILNNFINILIRNNNIFIYLFIHHIHANASNYSM